MSKVRLAALVLASSAAAVVLGVTAACTEGTTPDCSGANAAQCGSFVDGAPEADASLLVPEAAPPSSTAGDAGDAAPGADAEAGSLDLLDGG